MISDIHSGDSLYSFCIALHTNVVQDLLFPGISLLGGRPIAKFPPTQDNTNTEKSIYLVTRS